MRQEKKEVDRKIGRKMGRERLLTTNSSRDERRRIC